MTTDSFIRNAIQQLNLAGIKTARLDALILMEDELGKNRASILAHPEIIIPPVKLEKLNKKITQRTKHTPLAYIRKRAAFYGRDFYVDKHVLVPRPETEAIIELLTETAMPETTSIADIGTGSGCIGITAALELPGSRVDLYDIDSKALAVANKNAANLQAPVKCFKANLLDNQQASYDVLLANLPYVPLKYPINAAAQHEPAKALFAGSDGMDLYRQFWKQVSQLPQKPDNILTESMPEQHAENKLLARQAGYYLQKTQDFIQQFTPTPKAQPQV